MGQSGATPPSDRALSPVIGGVLLIAIVVLLAAGAGALVFGLADEQQPAPTASLSLEPVAGTDQYQLVHHSGDRIDGDRVTVHGIENPETLSGTELVAGTTATVTPTAETITLVWFTDARDTSYIIAEFEIDPASAGGTGGTGGAGGSGSFATGTVFTEQSGSVIAVEGDGGSITNIANTSGTYVMGDMEIDIAGDDDVDISLINNSAAIRVVDANGDVTRLATDSDIPGSIETDKSRIAAGRWDGSPASVFFVNDNHDTLYRVAPGGSPQVVATPGNGVQAVSGVGDVDGDGTNELVFTDDSQQLRYVESGGSLVKINNGQLGSNVGIGTGELVDFDGDGTVAVIGVDGSNNVKINRDASGDGTTTRSTTDAAKSPITAADVDDDGDQEIVYVGQTNGRLKYVDDPLGSPSVAYLTDDSGNRIDGSKATGVTST